MGFGTDVFFEKLKNEIISSDGDGQIYYLLYQEVKDITYPIIKNKVPFEYVDDVFQEVFFSVWRNIASYLLNMENKSEGQRIAWLITVAKRRIADYYEKISKHENEKVYLEDIDYELVSNQITVEYKDELTSKMKDVLVRLFSISTSPEKILSFVYSKIILSSETSSGKPSITYDYLQGYRLYDIFNMMKRDLEEVLEVKIPQEVYYPLQKKMDKEQNGMKVGDSLFELNVKTIIDGTNRIQKKLEAGKSR